MQHVWKHRDRDGGTSQSSSRGLGPLGYLEGVGGWWWGEPVHPPRQPVLHTQVLLSAGVFLQLLAKD